MKSHPKDIQTIRAKIERARAPGKIYGIFEYCVTVQKQKCWCKNLWSFYYIYDQAVNNIYDRANNFSWLSMTQPMNDSHLSVSSPMQMLTNS